MNLKENWWKWVGILLLCYVMTMGLLAPLTAGITQTTPDNTHTGSTLSLNINGYNTQFMTDKPRVWLKRGSHSYLAAQTITPLNDQNLTATFDLNGQLDTSARVVDMTLVIDSKTEGTLVLPSAISITQDSSAAANPLPMITKLDALHGNVAGFHYPFLNILEESIRNLFFHVPMWFGMLILFGISVWHSVRYLMRYNTADTYRDDYSYMPYRAYYEDTTAVAFALVGVLYGILGLITGMLWAKYTWGQAWSFDVKQNSAAAAVAIYAAYFVLRGSFEEEEKSARMGAIYNIFAFATLIPLLFIIPRMTDSLHPGNGGNPAFSKLSLNGNMRLVFYPAVIGWTILGGWIATIVRRYIFIKEKINNTSS
jgi:heme exporter protein C